MSLVTRRPSFTTYQELSEYRNLFSCLICMELFTNPRILECNHIFCEQCLQSYYAIYQDLGSDHQGVALHCPTCRKPTPLSVGGRLQDSSSVESPLCPSEYGVQIPMQLSDISQPHRKLSRNGDSLLRCDVCFFQNLMELADFYCNKCAMNLCKTCRLTHDTHPLFKGHFVIHASNKETLDLCCELHRKMTIIYFCLDCNIPVCVVCILRDHQTHQTVKLREALTKRRDHLKTILNDFGPRLDKLEAAAKTLEALYSSQAEELLGQLRPQRDFRLEATNSQLSDYQATTGSSVGPKSIKINGMARSFSNPFQRLSSLSEASFNSLKDVTKSQDDRLDAAMEEPSLCVRKSKFTKISTGKDENVTKSRHLSSDQPFFFPRHPAVGKRSIGDGNRPRQSEIQPAVANLTLSSDAKYRAIVLHVSRHRKLFNLSTKVLEMSQSKKLLAIYDDMVDRIRTVVEVEVNQFLDELNRRIVLERAKKMAAESSTHSLGDSSSSRSRSNSRVILSAGCGAANGAQRSMLVRPKLVWKIEKQRNDVGEMWNPSDVTFLADDMTVIVAEYDSVNEKNNKLQLFDASGKSLGVLAQGQIHPLGVAVTRDGNIAVTDCKGKRVKVVTPTGSTVTDIGKGQFGWPYGITVNSRGQLIVTDAFNDTVSIFQMDGKRIKIFGSTGSQHSHFRNPYHVTVDARDNIIVSDSGNNCIKVFDSSGKFLFYATEAMRRPSAECSIERKVKRRTLRGPRGIAVDLNGNILVADDCSRVCMFDSYGRYIRNLLTEEDSVKYPEAVHCSPNGLLAVTEWNPNNMFAIKIFNMYE